MKPLLILILLLFIGCSNKYDELYSKINKYEEYLRNIGLGEWKYKTISEKNNKRCQVKVLELIYDMDIITNIILNDNKTLEGEILKRRILKSRSYLGFKGKCLKYFKIDISPYVEIKYGSLFCLNSKLSKLFDSKFNTGTDGKISYDEVTRNWHKDKQRIFYNIVFPFGGTHLIDKKKYEITFDNVEYLID